MSILDFFSTEVEKWQKKVGLELLKFSAPVYGENGDGERVRFVDASNLMSVLHETVRRARADPLYGINWRAAVEKHAAIVAREVQSERDAGKFNRRRKKSRRRKRA